MVLNSFWTKTHSRALLQLNFDRFSSSVWGMVLGEAHVQPWDTVFFSERDLSAVTAPTAHCHRFHLPLFERMSYTCIKICRTSATSNLAQ